MSRSSHGHSDLLKRLSLDSNLVDYIESNKCVEQMLKKLGEEQRRLRREKLAVARLQREVTLSRSRRTTREKMISELEEERRLRLESEERLREVTEEAELGRAQMVSLQQHFSSSQKVLRGQIPLQLSPNFVWMEETVRTLLQTQMGLDHTSLRSCKDNLSDECASPEQTAEASGQPEDGGPEEEEDKSRLLLERLQALETENSALATANEKQREQYERCLDEVANQVVQALLTQKDLREECVNLRTRVFDLERQNRTLSALFAQRVRPASDLLLQKLHSKILGLSCGDLFLDTKGKSFLWTRRADSPPHGESHLKEKAGRHMARCLSQLSLTMPNSTYLQSSCSSSELSVSSACSEYSTSSYTCSEKQSGNKAASLTWEKMSSAPSDIHAPSEEKQSTRKKECHILEGLKRLQRRRHKKSTMLACKSGYKDCMNSNEGIYSLGTKRWRKGFTKSTLTMRHVRGRKFPYDSDDADDESQHKPTFQPEGAPKNCWRKLPHGRSDSLCSLDGVQSDKTESSRPVGGLPAHELPGYTSKEHPEKVFKNDKYILNGKTHTYLSQSLFHFHVNPKEQRNSHPLITGELPDLPSKSDPVQWAEQLKRNFKRLSKEVDKPLNAQCGRTDLSQAQQASSSVKLHQLDLCSLKSEEKASIGVEGETVDNSPYHTEKEGRLQSVSIHEYSELPPEEMPECNIAEHERSYSSSDCPEKLDKLHPHSPKGTTIIKHDIDGELLKVDIPQLQTTNNKTYSRGHKTQPNVYSTFYTTANFTKISSHEKGSPQINHNNTTTETNNTEHQGCTELKSPLSPPVKLPKFNRLPVSDVTHNSKVTKCISKNDSSKATSATTHSSPLQSKRSMMHVDYSEPPTRDRQCELNLMPPSPPPPPDRSTSLLVKQHYDNSSQALKDSLVPNNLKATLSQSQQHPHKLPFVLTTSDPDKDKSLLPDLSQNMEGEPQKLIESNPYHLNKLLPPFQSSNCVLGNLSPPASMSKVLKTKSASQKPKGFPVQSTQKSKKGQLPSNESSRNPLQISCNNASPLKKDPLTPSNISCLAFSSADDAEKVSKPCMHFGNIQKSSTVPGKQEKDQLNAASKGSPTSVTGPSCDVLTGVSRLASVEESPVAHCHEEFEEQPCQLSTKAIPEFDAPDKDVRLFKRSISVTTKPHLKPALGMNGAKARSQSFSTNYMEKPNISMLVRTQIITNTGERLNSLTRQSSNVDNLQSGPTSENAESPSRCLNSPQVSQGTTSHSIVGKNENRKSQAHNAVRSLPVTSKFSIKSSKQSASVEPHSKSSRVSLPFHSPSHSPEAAVSKLLSPVVLNLTKTAKQKAKGSDKPSPSGCSIEEKVMMGIEENIQKCQGQDKALASETKLKTGSSLANWFGFRKSKLPALNSKKVDPSKAKEEKKELKAGLPLAPKQAKWDKKKKNEVLCKDRKEQAVMERNEKETQVIEDHHGFQRKYPSNSVQIQTCLSGNGKEALVPKPQLSRVDGKALPTENICKGRSRSDSWGATQRCRTRIAGTSTYVQDHPTTVPQMVENEDVPEPPCQDRMIGSSRQMRTLDSGIGTFPKSDSTPEASPEPAEELRTSCRSKALPRACTATPSQPSSAFSRLPKPASAGVTKVKRLSQVEQKASPAVTSDAQEDCMEKKAAKDHSFSADRLVRACMYSGSSSETETEADFGAAEEETLASVRRKSKQTEQEEKAGVRSSRSSRLSIMDFFGHQDDTPAETNAADESAERVRLGFTSVCLESLNKRNSACASLTETPQMSQTAPKDSDKQLWSLSDSLYDSFSSSTSQLSSHV